MIDCYTEWWCCKLEKRILTHVEAIPMVVNGEGLWECDCRSNGRLRWTSGKDEGHVPLKRGFRNSPYEEREKK